MKWFRRRKLAVAAGVPCPNGRNHEYGGDPCPACGGSLTRDERDELLRLSNESNARALADARSRGYERIVDDPKYEDFFVGID